MSPIVFPFVATFEADHHAPLQILTTKVCSTDKTEAHSDALAIVNGSCKAHYHSVIGLHMVGNAFHDVFTPYGQLLTVLRLTLEEGDAGLPDDLPELMADLEVLVVDGYLTRLPPSMCHMSRLKLVRLFLQNMFL